MNKQATGAFVLVIVSIAIGAIIPIAIYNSSKRFSLVPERGQLERESGGEGRKFGQELEEEGKRKKESEETIANYKKEFGKNFAAILKADIDEFKKERGLDEFRKQFAYDLIEYEAYKGETLFEDQWGSPQGEPETIYGNVFSADMLDVEISK